MILSMTNFKARLIAIPEVPKERGSDEMRELGKFTLNKKYRIYSIYSEKEFTDFLVADDNGFFVWVNTIIFRK